MPPTVLLYTDRLELESPWRTACEEAAAVLRRSAPDSLPHTVQEADAVVFDGASESYDEDELLASVGLARALHVPAAVLLPEGSNAAAIQDVLDELTGGLVVRSHAEIGRIAAALTRRADRERGERFEYLTVSPRGNELLAIMGDGQTALVSRPLNTSDDGSEIAAIQLAPDARSASLELASGQLTLLASAVRPRAALNGHAQPSAQSGADVDGVRLGARLRELRLAAGLTQAELARRTGIHRPNIARVEAGRHTPSLETLSRLAAAIGVPTTHVLSG